MAKPESKTFNGFVTADGSSGFLAKKGRYHLYISYACPWASRCYAALKLKGLDDVIGVTVVKPVWEKTRPGESHVGWTFATSAEEEPGCTPDPIKGGRYIRDLYELVDPHASTFSVPLLWDTATDAIVSNDSAAITRMLNSQFNAFAANAALDLCPAALQPTIDGLNSWITADINKGVHRCGFAQSQAVYDEAVTALFAALDRCEALLSVQRYLAGDAFTEADIRLFVDLIRFDEVYYGHFNCNKKSLREYPNLFNYTKEIFQMPEMRQTVDMDHIKRKFFRSPNALNPFAIVPIGPNIDYSAPHNRHSIPPAAGRQLL